jgi:hypothetical protein
MLVDQRRALAIVPHPGHEIPELGAAGCRERIAGMAQIVKCRPSASIDFTACGQADILLNLHRRSGPPLTPGNTSAHGSSLTKIARCLRRTGMIACGMPTTRRPALDLGGPSRISPVDRSMKAARTRTVPASESRGERAAGAEVETAIRVDRDVAVLLADLATQGLLIRNLVVHRFAASQPGRRATASTRLG